MARSSSTRLCSFRNRAAPFRDWRAEGFANSARVAGRLSIHLHSRGLQDAVSSLPQPIKESWICWICSSCGAQYWLSDLIEEDPVDVAWRTKAETRRLLALMSDVIA